MKTLHPQETDPYPPKPHTCQVGLGPLPTRSNVLFAAMDPDQVECRIFSTLLSVGVRSLLDGICSSLVCRLSWSKEESLCTRLSKSIFILFTLRNLPPQRTFESSLFSPKNIWGIWVWTEYESSDSLGHKVTWRGSTVTQIRSYLPLSLVFFGPTPGACSEGFQAAVAPSRGGRAEDWGRKLTEIPQ